ncbi:MAG: hypothetical protein GXP29_04880 [Planctomycetes bacterium]|nr:hypothetical protein [Planctomycetota bacterium]
MGSCGKRYRRILLVMPLFFAVVGCETPVPSGGGGVGNGANDDIVNNLH